MKDLFDFFCGDFNKGYLASCSFNLCKKRNSKTSRVGKCVMSVCLSVQCGYFKLISFIHSFFLLEVAVPSFVGE